MHGLLSFKTFGMAKAKEAQRSQENLSMLIETSANMVSLIATSIRGNPFFPTP